jgi:DNA polymerase-3 subunit beta
MRLAIDRAALLKALQHVSSVVERRVTIPILSNVLVAAGEGVLRLKATDLDIEVCETVAANTETPGETTVSAHMLHDIVRKLPDGSQVELALDESGNHVNLSAGPARFALACLPATDFPDIASEEMSHSFALPAGALRKFIERTRFAISTEETRYYLNGIYFHTVSGDDGERLCAVATDGHRLAKTDGPMPDGAQGMPGVIIPRKTVAEVFKLLTDRSAPVQVGLSSAKIRFAFDSGEEAHRRHLPRLWPGDPDG